MDNRSRIAEAVASSNQIATGNAKSTVGGRDYAFQHWQQFAIEKNIPSERFGDGEDQISMIDFIESKKLVESFGFYMSEKSMESGELYKTNSVLQYIGRVMEIAKRQYYEFNDGANIPKCAEFFKGYIFSGLKDTFTKDHWYRKMLHEVGRICAQRAINNCKC